MSYKSLFVLSDVNLVSQIVWKTVSWDRVLPVSNSHVHVKKSVGTQYNLTFNVSSSIIYIRQSLATYSFIHKPACNIQPRAQCRCDAHRRFTIFLNCVQPINKSPKMVTNHFLSRIISLCSINLSIVHPDKLFFSNY